VWIVLEGRGDWEVSGVYLVRIMSVKVSKPFLPPPKKRTYFSANIIDARVYFIC